MLHRQPGTIGEMMAEQPNPITKDFLPARIYSHRNTAWPRMRRMRQQGQTPPRYCDFSSSSDK
jgi:hypothetical protein